MIAVEAHSELFNAETWLRTLNSFSLRLFKGKIEFERQRKRMRKREGRRRDWKLEGRGVEAGIS